MGLLLYIATISVFRKPEQKIPGSNLRPTNSTSLPKWPFKYMIPFWTPVFFGAPPLTQFPSESNQRKASSNEKNPTADLRLDTHSRTKDISKLETTYKRTFHGFHGWGVIMAGGQPKVITKVPHPERYGPYMKGLGKPWVSLKEGRRLNTNFWERIC